MLLFYFSCYWCFHVTIILFLSFLSVSAEYKFLQELFYFYCYWCFYVTIQLFLSFLSVPAEYKLPQEVTTALQANKSITKPHLRRNWVERKRKTLRPLLLLNKTWKTAPKSYPAITDHLQMLFFSSLYNKLSTTLSTGDSQSILAMVKIDLGPYLAAEDASNGCNR